MKRERKSEEYIDAAKNSFSIAEMCRKLSLKPCGGNYKLMHRMIKELEIDTKHFRGQGWNINLKFKPSSPKPLSEILIINSSYQSHKLKKRLLNEGVKEHICENCHLTEWKGHKIPLELHHINGDNTDNRLENIQLLCPNCHALTDSYRGKNNRSKQLNPKQSLT